ncbi:hypothetical protein CAEBREN_13417 [Caenorhabditis brenneri]|uniref:Uncharacterized protein n=1 Tax=Caenorhabditis brenneri TaxID=135651 RepID=G0NVD9_CAEBE|nr:hypothetical protein CAEBREN_13417 [Caenorhabditis brenneri]
MMNSRCPWLIAIAILFNCADSGRLSDKENKERIANCGKPELPTPAEGEKLEGSKVTFGDNSYIVRVKTRHHAEYFTTGFFISPRHILTSSQSVFNEEKHLRFNSTYQITKGVCTIPMLVELKEDRNEVQFPCVADSTTEVKVNDEVHAYRWKGKRVFPQPRKVMEIYSDSYYFKRKIDEVQEKLIATSKKQYKGNVRGGPLVMHKTPKGTLAIGIDATSE